MATEPELKRGLAEERRGLTNAVAELREELGQTADRGKKSARGSAPWQRALAVRRR